MIILPATGPGSGNSIETYIKPVVKARLSPIFRRRGIFRPTMTGIGRIKTITSIANEIDPRAIVASVRAVTQEKRNGGVGRWRFGLHEMPAYNSVMRPPRVPKTTRN